MCELVLTEIAVPFLGLSTKTIESFGPVDFGIDGILIDDGRDDGSDIVLGGRIARSL